MSHSIPDSSGLNIVSRVESLILIATGLGAGWLAISENYTLLMDPRFRLVTLSGAIAITVMGVTGLVNARKTGLSGLLTFALFFAIVLIGRPFATDSPSARMTGIRAPEGVVVESSDFPEIDLAELDRQLRKDVLNEFGVAASILGKVMSMPRPDRFGQWILMRSYIDFDPFDGSLPAKERGDVNRWLTKHIMVGKHTRKQLFYQESLQTIDGRQIGIREDNGRLILEDSRILLSDITANNGVIHLIYPSLKRD